MSDRPTPEGQTLNVWICDACGRLWHETDRPFGSHDHAGTRLRCHGPVRLQAFVQASALDHWRARSQGLEEALREARDTIDLYARFVDGDRTATARIGVATYSAASSCAAHRMLNEIDSALASLSVPERDAGGLKPYETPCANCGEAWNQHFAKPPGFGYAQGEASTALKCPAQRTTFVPADHGAAPPPRGAAREIRNVEETS